MSVHPDLLSSLCFILEMHDVVNTVVSHLGCDVTIYNMRYSRIKTENFDFLDCVYILIDVKKP